MAVRISIVTLFAFTLAACTSSDTSEMKVHEQNIAIARKVFEHFNKHEWEQMAGLYADSAEFKDPSFGQEIVKQSRQQIIAKYAKLEQMSADVRDDIVQLYPSGSSYVAVEFVSSGTMPNGAKWKLPICTIFTVENGLITKDFTYFDN
jgi:ketosteroid isomerase-like protein